MNVYRLIGAVTLLGLLADVAAAATQEATEVAGSLNRDTLVLIHAAVLPMTRDTVLSDQTLVISGGVIVDVHPTGSRSVPPGASVRSLAGRYVLPGLIDAHVHLREPEESLVLFPANGVTTVVNLEGTPSHLRLRDSIADAGSFAPRIVSSGPYLEGVAATAAEARVEVERQRTAGYD